MTVNRTSQLFCSLMLTFVAFAASSKEPNPSSVTSPVSKQFIVHLEPGKAWDPSLSPAEQKNFKEHSANMNSLRKQGVIQMGARYSKYGMLVIQGDSLESMTELMNHDPGVMAGIFIFKIEPISIFYPWVVASE